MFWMVFVLMPTEKETPFGFDPTNPVAVVVSTGLYVEADLKSRTFDRVARIPEEVFRIYVRNHSIGSRLSRS
jgi:hypothetical protein